MLPLVVACCAVAGLGVVARFGSRGSPVAERVRVRVEVRVGLP